MFRFSKLNNNNQPNYFGLAQPDFVYLDQFRLVLTKLNLISVVGWRMGISIPLGLGYLECAFIFTDNSNLESPLVSIKSPVILDLWNVLVRWVTWPSEAPEEFSPSVTPQLRVIHTRTLSLHNHSFSLPSPIKNLKPKKTQK